MTFLREKIATAVEESDQPIIIEFHGDHCAPCITQENVLAYAALRTTFPAKLVSVNVDKTPEIAERFAITSVPTVLVIEKGKTTARFSGLIHSGSVIGAIQSEQSRANRHRDTAAKHAVCVTFR